ncbi:hypothetical protein HF329_14175 [Chitinophaga oryzae]|uniref:Uncharacterized protein n=1 Tax=Chitinophaga oryzae TaxID=2725414 RepID=A0AAE6ZG96_9BACT|nr:hypothetical protein [Chitinophaga oryzae]QJB32410.1 hypothetical protein HF329_14175 [Chitinophaga oryzae]
MILLPAFADVRKVHTSNTPNGIFSANGSPVKVYGKQKDLGSKVFYQAAMPTAAF